MVLAAVDAVVLDKHEHIPPPMFFVSFHSLVVGLQSLELGQVLLLDPESIVLELVVNFLGMALEEMPVGIEGTREVLKHNFQDDPLLEALLPGEFDQFSEAGHD